MPLKYFKPNPSMVGSYVPSKEWSNYTQFCVMENKSTGLIAAVGYFQHLKKEEVWGWDDYQHAAECIEQAQLYAAAPQLLELLEALIESPNSELIEKAKKLCTSIADIEETATRLLGEYAIQIIQAQNIVTKCH